jgi:hypothetical protein
MEQINKGNKCVNSLTRNILCEINNFYFTSILQILYYLKSIIYVEMLN